MHWKRRFSRRISRRCCGDFTSTSPSTTASASWIGFVTKSSSGEERCVGAASDTGCSGATSGAAHGLNCRTRRLHIRQSEEAETRQRSGEPGRGNLHAGFWGGGRARNMSEAALYPPFAPAALRAGISLTGRIRAAGITATENDTAPRSRRNAERSSGLGCTTNYPTRGGRNPETPDRHASAPTPE